jgi:hypothetical protein
MPITLNNELAGFRSDGLFFRRCHCTATCPQSLTTSNIIQIGMPITLNNELAGFLSDGLFFRRCHCTATCPQSLTNSNIKYVLIGLKQPDVTAFLTLLDHELEHGLVLATRLP